MSAKVQYVRALQEQAVNALANVNDVVSELENIYFDEGYNSGGADPIAEVGSIITLLQQFQNFTGNAAVTTGDYAATLNTTRSNLPGSDRVYR
jgi:hypothetical protein